MARANVDAARDAIDRARLVRAHRGDRGERVLRRAGNQHVCRGTIDQRRAADGGERRCCINRQRQRPGGGRSVDRRKVRRVAWRRRIPAARWPHRAGRDQRRGLTGMHAEFSS